MQVLFVRRTAFFSLQGLKPQSITFLVIVPEECRNTLMTTFGNGIIIESVTDRKCDDIKLGSKIYPWKKPPPSFTLQLSGSCTALKHQASISSANQASMRSEVAREGWIRRGDEKDLVVPITHSKHWRRVAARVIYCLLHGFPL